MGGRIIKLFMWGYQDTFRIILRLRAREILECLGADLEVEALLVGVLCPDCEDRNQVCIEPETDDSILPLFADLEDEIVVTIKDHPSKNIIYDDRRSMDEKPEMIRRDSVRIAIAKRLEKLDAINEVTSFSGDACRVGKYHVVPIIQIPNSTIAKFPPLPPKPVAPNGFGQGYRSFIHAAFSAMLDEATEELRKPEPANSVSNIFRSAEEIVRIAAKNFLYTPLLAIETEYLPNHLFDTLNLVSSLLYEGVKGTGHLILVNKKSAAVEFAVQFERAVPLSDPRWMRKVLQMATTGIGIIADTQFIYGLGRLKNSHDAAAQDAFSVVFHDQYHWELQCGDQVLIRSHYAVPTLPKDPFEKSSFISHYNRLFPGTDQEDARRLWALLLVQKSQVHGSMIVVASDAAEEAERLRKQGTNIFPIPLTTELLKCVSSIDGTILINPKGYCYAIGVILDGEANENCTPSRGSRYNSGIRYVYTTKHSRLAIVVSEDRTIDVIPPIRALISRNVLQKHINAFVNSTIDNYHGSRLWLDNHRFYINSDQCKELNKSILRLNGLKKGRGIHLATRQFEPDSDMDDSYLYD